MLVRSARLANAAGACVRVPVAPFATSASSSSSSSSSSRLSPPPPARKVLSLEDLRSQVRAGDFEGYLCGNFMPTGARDAYFALRALNIELAQVRDATKGNAAMARVRMAFWRDVVDRAFQGAGAGGEGAAAAAPGPPSPVTSHPLFQSLRAAVHRHGLTRRWVERMIDAREADTDGVAPKTTDELAQYGERTSGSLLFLSLESIGVRDGRADEAAAAVGRALGLCTALRALPVHARLGQRYIPDEVMERHNLTEEELFIRPDEVTTAEGTPLLDAAAAAEKSASTARRAGDGAPLRLDPKGRALGLTLARSGSGFAGAVDMQAAPASSPAGPASAAAAPAAPPKPAARSGGGDSGVRLTLSPAAARLEKLRRELAETGGAVPPATPAPAQAAHGHSHAGGHTHSHSHGHPSSGAAEAALRSGIGAPSLVLHKSPETVRKIRAAVRDLAGAAQGHLDVARALAPSLPMGAAAALLPAVPASRFLSRLSTAQEHDVFAAGGLGPWQDGRSAAKLLLQIDLLAHTLRNKY